MCFRVIFFIVFLFFSNRISANTFSKNNSSSVTNNPVINEYSPVVSLEKCKNIITVEDGSKFKVGDTVLIIQMKGAEINLTNSASFGFITDYKNCGNYEFNYVKSKSGNSIELKNKLQKQYDIPTGKVQLIRVPYYINFSVTTELTCLPWDGKKGGVLVFLVRDTLKLNANLNVSNKGFTGGKGINTFNMNLHCGELQYFYPRTSNLAALKGEGISELPEDKVSGRGSPANGGGGGQDHNSGGGGGGNGGIGGKGGFQYQYCTGSVDNRGEGGKALLINNATGKIFLGGGGGAGHCNNEGFNSSGGNGGGIILFKAKHLTSNNFSINANGQDAAQCTPNSVSGYCHEGMGGGGAGGTVLIDVDTHDKWNVNIKGGVGGNMNSDVDFGKLGPGGGGGGGAFWFNKPALPSVGNYTLDLQGGNSGVNSNLGNNKWGAENGNTGVVLLNYTVPFDILPFSPNIDSIRIASTKVSCFQYNFNTLDFTNTSPITTYYWDFGDGNTSSNQNNSHIYSAEGDYTVKLIGIDANGCKDSTSKLISIRNCSSCNLNFDFYYDYDPCSPLSVKFHGTGTDISNPKWIFDDGSTITGNLSPVKTFTSEGLHTVKYIVSNSGCSDTIVKTINVKVYPENIILTPNSTICKGSSILLNTSVALDFCWNPSTFLDNPLSPTPIASPTHDITYYFSSLETGTNLIANGNFESGNTGFNSEYLYNPSSGFNGGVYTVSSNILAWHPGMVGCVDHTSGSGKMLLVNGSSDVGAKVWSKTIPVTPNTDYNFSTWLQNISFLNPAQLQFQINGSQIGPVFTANNASCVWEQFNASWNSGSATTANISITNQNSVFSGNDFALDDIVFATVKIKRDSVVIKVDNPVVKSINDSTICEGASLTLLTSGAATYNWTPASGLNNVNSSSPVATPTVSSQYIVTGTTTAGCIAKDTVNITVKPKPVIKTIADSTFCGSRSVVLSTTGGNTYSWSPAAGLSNPNIANPTFTGTTPQQYVYYVTGTASNGCSAKDTVKLKLNEQPVVSTISDASICEGVALQLTTSSTAQNHSWSPATAVSNANSVSPMFTATSNQTLIITGTTTAGCIAKDTVNITVKPKPTVKTIPDTTICGTANITLTTTGGNSYSWSPATFLNNPSIANPVFTGNASTLYIVTGTGLNGCSAKDSVQVNVFSKPTFNAPQNKSVCLGNSVQLSGNNGSGFSYSWSPASSLSNTNIEAPFANPATTTNFSVKITDNNCMYDSTFVVVVTVNPRPVIKASKSNDIDCSHPRSNLNASGGTSYVWSPATYLNNSNIGNPVASPTSTIKYVVTGTDINGCSNKDSVTVLLKGLSNFNFVIPNSFTPNDDNLNDCFSLKYWGKMDNFTLKIYNRWGELVFETNDNSVCWDGKYKGKQCEKGNYVYYVRGSSSCGSVNKKGNLLLIR